MPLTLALSGRMAEMGTISDRRKDSTRGLILAGVQRGFADQRTLARIRPREERSGEGIYGIWSWREPDGRVMRKRRRRNGFAGMSFRNGGIYSVAPRICPGY